MSSYAEEEEEGEEEEAVDESLLKINETLELNYQKAHTIWQDKISQNIDIHIDEISPEVVTFLIKEIEQSQKGLQWLDLLRQKTQSFMTIHPETQLSGSKFKKSIPRDFQEKDIIQIIDHYKTHVSQRYVSKLYNQIDEMNLNPPIVATVKVDGQFVVLIWRKNHPSFFVNSPTHRIIMGLPINDKIDQLLEKQPNLTKVIVVGEMYASYRTLESGEIDYESYFGEKDRSRVYHITTALNPKSQKDLDRIGFRVFDILDWNGPWPNQPYAQTLDFLVKTFGPASNKNVTTIEYKIINDDAKAQVKAYFKAIVDEKKAEGIVVHSGMTYKIKPVHQIDAVIIGIANGLIGARVGPDMLASCLVALQYKENGPYQILTNVGGGFSDQERKTLWTQFTPVSAPGFYLTTSDGRVYQMVEPHWVVQLEYLDYLTEVQNEPILVPKVLYNPERTEWTIVENVPFVRLISPRISSDNGIRKDKTPPNIHDIPAYSDVRIEQMTDIIPIETVSLPKIPDVKSELIYRETFSKTQTEAVKKILIWKTNKAVGDFMEAVYPRYVFYFIDWGQQRTVKGKRQIIGANSIEQIEKLLPKCFAKSIYNKEGVLPRGWEPKAKIDHLNQFKTIEAQNPPIEMPPLCLIAKEQILSPTETITRPEEKERERAKPKEETSIKSPAPAEKDTYTVEYKGKSYTILVFSANNKFILNGSDLNLAIAMAMTFPNTKEGDVAVFDTFIQGFDLYYAIPDVKVANLKQTFGYQWRDLTHEDIQTINHYAEAMKKPDLPKNELHILPHEIPLISQKDGKLFLKKSEFQKLK